MKISSKVIKGLGLGTKLGFPTMNLNPACAPTQLEHGVYAVRVKTASGGFNGVMHFGERPAVKAPISLEVHCFGLNKSLLGENIEIEIKKRLRDVKEFSSMDELKNAIEKDINEAKICFSACP